MANYSFRPDLIPNVSNGHTFTRDLFNQAVPHTKILEGKTGLTFNLCHLMNCDCPPDSVFIGREPRHISLCSHIHPEWVVHGLPACVENCSHVVEYDTVIIDGQSVITNYYYEDTEVV